MKKLSLFEQELNEMGVKIVEDENLGLCVSYKSLHKYCEIRTHHSTYFKRNVDIFFKVEKDYKITWTSGDFKIENVENTNIEMDRGYINNMTAKGLYLDYLLTLDCAKHVALMSKAPKGFEIRDYFIKMEKLASDYLQQEIERLKFDRLYGSTEIVKYINVPNLLSSSLYVYMSDILQVGAYNVSHGNKNRTFKANDDFDSRAISLGIARRGKANDVLFYKQFADVINNCEYALEDLQKINIIELNIRNKGIENRKPF